MIFTCFPSLDKVLKIKIPKMMMMIFSFLSSVDKVLQPISQSNIISDQQLQRIQSNLPTLQSVVRTDNIALETNVRKRKGKQSRKHNLFILLSMKVTDQCNLANISPYLADPGEARGCSTNTIVINKFVNLFSTSPSSSPGCTATPSLNGLRWYFQS